MTVRTCGNCRYWLLKRKDSWCQKFWVITEADNECEFDDGWREPMGQPLKATPNREGGEETNSYQ